MSETGDLCYPLRTAPHRTLGPVQNIQGDIWLPWTHLPQPMCHGQLGFQGKKGYDGQYSHSTITGPVKHDGVFYASILSNRSVTTGDLNPGMCPKCGPFCQDQISRTIWWAPSMLMNVSDLLDRTKCLTIQ